jgi:hypothetical protein
MPHQGIEAFLHGARMARQLAAAEENPAERARHIERAQDYEMRAGWMIERAERNEQELLEAAE